MEVDSFKSVTLRGDLFQDKKCVHIKLDKDVHAALRTLSFQKNVSMQEMFEEFARLISDNDNKALRIVDALIMRKLNLPKKINRYKKKRVAELNDLDKQSLYDLIDSQALNDGET